jgi:hypothetical protein
MSRSQSDSAQEKEILKFNCDNDLDDCHIKATDSAYRKVRANPELSKA